MELIDLPVFCSLCSSNLLSQCLTKNNVLTETAGNVIEFWLVEVTIKKIASIILPTEREILPVYICKHKTEKRT